MTSTPRSCWLIATLLWLASQGLTGCTTVAESMYGMRQPDAVDYPQVSEYAQEYGVGVAPGKSFALDVSYYEFLKRQPLALQDVAKNHAQPLQLLYYNRAGQLISYYVNCYAGGFPNLDWNHNDQLEVFPPVSQAPTDSMLSFTKLAPFLRTVGGSRIQAMESLADYTVVVFWSHRMGRQSRRLLAAAQKNLERAPTGQKTYIMYVNNDAYLRHVGL
ncbi:hypothetical protein [Hymenobacter norwichensis]|uniref:hypothetical protein n=1 Tax=Hymenobacter norwichensis TaxID=223903 RepID=UPI0003B6E876|nr:hypothetical protein [Hymenobacter norwichensis]